MMSDTPQLDAAIHAKPPRRLFHYTSIEGLRGIASSRTLWASAAQYLNDAKELRLAIDLARWFLTTAATKAGDQPSARLLRYYHDQLERLEHYAVCIFSLSEQGDLLSQWRSYCPPGGGYAIGFPGAELRTILEAQGCWLAKCEYQPAMHHSLVSEAVRPLVQKLPQQIPEIEEELTKFGELQVPELFHRLSRVAPLIKHESFAEEREWRIIWIPYGQSERYRYRPNRNLFIPYIPLSLTGADGQTIPIEVVVGPMPHQHIATTGLTGFLAQERMPWSVVRPSATPYRPL